MDDREQLIPVLARRFNVSEENLRGWVQQVRYALPYGYWAADVADSWENAKGVPPGLCHWIVTGVSGRHYPGAWDPAAFGIYGSGSSSSSDDDDDDCQIKLTQEMERDLAAYRVSMEFIEDGTAEPEKEET